MDSVKVLNFLERLAANNNREWFADHKAEFDGYRKDFEELVQSMINQLAVMDDSMRGVLAKDCVFRIYRDTRFHDKTPYKTHFGAYMAKGGRKSPMGAYYLHIEPGNSFVSGGIYCPEPEVLNRLRQTVADNCDEFVEILHSAPFADYFKTLYGETLKRLPLKFANTTIAHPDLLKHKHYLVDHALSDAFFKQSDWAEQALEILKTTYPLNRFLNEIFMNQ